GNGAGGGLEPGQSLLHRSAQAVTPLAFQRQQSLFGAQHSRFQLLQLRGNVALGIRQRLPAFIVSRDRPALSLADLDVVTVPTIEADPTRSDAGAFPLPSLNPCDELFAAISQLASGIHFRVSAGADYVVVPDGSRWTVDQGSGQLGNQI